MAGSGPERPAGPSDTATAPVPARKSKRARRRERRIAIAAVAITLAVVVAVLVLRYQELANPPTASPGPTVLAALHTSWTLLPGYYEALSFDLRVAATVTGGLFASQGMDVYLFNTTEYAAFNATGATSSHAYASGNVTSARVYVDLPTGGWDLVVANPSSVTTTVVTVTTAVLATASG